MNPTIDQLESNGTIVVDEHPVDYGYVSNAGDATIYLYNGRQWMVTVWRGITEDHNEGQITIQEYAF